MWFRYYFGVGGGSMDFIKSVNQDGRMSVHVVAVFEDGCSNTREIIMVRKRPRV